MRIKRLLGLVLGGVLLTTTTATAAPHDATIIEGRNRYETSTKVSQSGFTTSAAAVIVSGDSYADAISGLPLAGKYQAPILLTGRNSLPQNTLNELERLDVKRVFIVGGTNTITTSVENVLRGRGYDVVRLYGASRYETNRKVNDYVFENKDTRTNVFVVNATSFADMLSAGPVVYSRKAPIILSDTTGSQMTMPFKNVDTSYIIGGTTTLNTSVARKTTNPQRISGSNRFTTSAAIDAKFFPNSDKVYLASGHTFADAISAVPLTQGTYPLRLVDKYASEINDSRQKVIVGGLVKDDVSASKNAAVYINPHQDDETLSMGTQLVRDINLGREVYILQFTLGEATGTYNTINSKLQNEGYNTISRLELGTARTREMTAGLVSLGIAADNVISYPYRQYEPTPRMVHRDIDTFIRQLPQDNIHFRVMLSDHTDTSAGSVDHVTVEQGLDSYMTAPYAGKTYNVLKFSTDKTTTTRSGFTKLVRTSEEDDMWEVMYDAYGVWNPSQGRYGIGRLSSPDSFEFHLNNPDGNQVIENR